MRRIFLLGAAVAALMASGCGDDGTPPAAAERGGGAAGSAGKGASGKAGSGAGGKGGAASAGAGGAGSGGAGGAGEGGAGGTSGSSGQGGGAGESGAGGGKIEGGDAKIFYVSPQGDDAWSGHWSAPTGGDGPFRTVGRAVEALNKEKDGAGVSIRVREGTYFLGSPLVITASGAPGKPAVIEAYPGERPVLSGGVELSGWADAGNGLARAPAGVPAEELRGRFQTLRVKGGGAGEGSWARLARWPKKGGELSNPEWQNPAFWLYARGTPVGGVFDGTTNFLSIPLQIADQAALASWDLSQAQVQFFPLTYSIYNLPVGQVSGGADPSLMVFTGPYGATDFLPEGMRFALSNIPQSITEGGEWAIDREGAQVFYKEPSGESAAAQSMVLGRLTRLLSITGVEGAHSHDVAVRGLIFTDTATSADDFLPYNTGDIAVDVSFADDVLLEGNGFEFLGGSALCVRSASQRVTARENVFAHVGQAAIEALSSTEVLPPASARAPGHLAVLGNYIADANHAGKLGAIYLFSASDSRIEGNLIFTAAGPGIQVLGLPESPSERNEILSNDVHTVNYGIADGGGIYLTSNVAAKLGNVVRGNRVLNVLGAYSDKGQLVSPAGGVGIYLDNFESGDSIQGNIVANTSDSCLFLHGSSDLTVVNNLLVDGAPSEMMLAGVPGSTMGNNVMFSNVIAATAGAPPGHALWRVSLNSGVSYPSALASGGNVFAALDPETVRVGEGGAPVVFYGDITGNSASHSFNAWQALAMDTNSTLGTLPPELVTDGAGRVVGFTAGALSAAGLGPLPDQATGLKHHAEANLQGAAKKACLLGLLGPLDVRRPIDDDADARGGAAVPARRLNSGASALPRLARASPGALLV